MPDPNLLSETYGHLTTPIREKPVSSLMFFVALLGAGLWLNKWFSGKPELWQQALVTLLLVLPTVGIILSLHRLLVMRDQPANLRDPVVLEGIKKSFVGRDEDADALVTLVLGSQQVWLNGDSGVGKSVLLQKAVLPELEKKGIPAIYLNSWRGDWEETPAKAILAKLNIASIANQESILEALQKLLESSNGLVIILDQFDEFQVEHRARFILEHGKVISRSQLEESNRFFRVLNSAVRLGRVRCVFVTRRDVEWGKRVVLLEEADEFFLKRLSRNIVEAEIGRIIPLDAVANAANGWHELREQLCDDLSDDGILPVQMRFAVLGLEELRHNLTRPAYVRIGQVNGLISRYIEREVRRVAGNQSVAVTLFPLLHLMVSPDGNSTVAISEESLLGPIPAESQKGIVRTLEELERADIVRRVLSQDGAVLWRLDHDYLAGPVREIACRQLPEQWELKERYQRFVVARAWQKVLRLAGPLTIARMIGAWRFRGLRFGSAVAWLLFSVSACLAISAGLIYTGFEVVARFRGQELGNRLFSVFGQDRQSFRAPLDAPEATSSSEAKALRQLADSDFFTRRAFLEAGLQSDENANRLISHRHGIAIALSRVDQREARQLYEAAIRPLITDPQTDQATLSAAFELLRIWGGASLLSGPQVDELTLSLEQRIAQDTNEPTLRELLRDLSVLQDKIGPQTAEHLATTLVQRMANNNDDSVLSNLVRGLNALKDKIRPQTADQLATTLEQRMVSDNNESVLSNLGLGLNTLKDEIGPKTAEQIATTLQQRMGRETDASVLPSLASGLGELKEKADLNTIEKAATILVQRMIAPDTSASALPALAFGLSEIKDKVDLKTIETAATILVQRMMAPDTDASVLRALAFGLGELKEKADSKTIETAATILVQRMMAPDTSASALPALASGLSKLKKEVNSKTIEKASAILVHRMMTPGTDTSVLSELAFGLGELKEKADSKTIEKAATILLQRMSSAANDSSFLDLTLGLERLSDRIEPKMAERVAIMLVDMADEPNIPALIKMPEVLEELEKKIRPETADRLATIIGRRLTNARDSSGLSELINGLRILKNKIKPETAEHLATTLKNRMNHEEGSSVAALAFGPGVLKGKITPQTRESLATTLIERMDNKVNREDDSALHKLASGLGSLLDKTEPQVDEHLAAMLVKRIATEKDDSVLRELGFALGFLPEGSLTNSAFAQVSPVFQVGNAPCRVVLLSTSSRRRSDIVRQLANPLCAETDWYLMAVEAAKISGQPIAHETQPDPEKFTFTDSSVRQIIVNFSELYAYVANRRPRHNSWLLDFPASASLVLLMAATLSCIFALVKVPTRSIPAPTSSRA